MNNHVERFRDALAGAVSGAIIAVIILLISLIVSAIRYAGTSSGGGTFESMRGGAFIAIMVVCVIVGAAVGYAVGYHWTKDEVIANSIQKWMLKHNK